MNTIKMMAIVQMSQRFGWMTWSIKSSTKNTFYKFCRDDRNLKILILYYETLILRQKSRRAFCVGSLMYSEPFFHIAQGRKLTSLAPVKIAANAFPSLKRGRPDICFICCQNCFLEDIKLALELFLSPQNLCVFVLCCYCHIRMLSQKVETMNGHILPLRLKKGEGGQNILRSDVFYTIENKKCI